MGLAILIIGLVVFLGAHVFVTFRDDARAHDRAPRPERLSRLFASMRWSALR